MSNEMIGIIGKMLNECSDIRHREKISTGTAADILHGYAYMIFSQLKNDSKSCADCHILRDSFGAPLEVEYQGRIFNCVENEMLREDLVK